MPTVIVMILIKAFVEAVRVFRRKAQATKPATLCAGCQYAHIQYASNARRAISCAYSGTVRPMKLDVLYCTDYEARNLPVRVRAIGFVRESIAAD